MNTQRPISVRKEGIVKLRNGLIVLSKSGIQRSILEPWNFSSRTIDGQFFTRRHRPLCSIHRIGQCSHIRLRGMYAYNFHDSYSRIAFSPY